MAITRRQFITAYRPGHGGHAARPEPVREPLRSPGDGRHHRQPLPDRPLPRRRQRRSQHRRAVRERRAAHARTTATGAPTAVGSTCRRGRSRVPPSAPIAATGTQLALHPGFSGLKQLYDLGKVAVVQGCGYPELQPLARRGQDHLADGEPARARRVRWHRLGRTAHGHPGRVQRQRRARRLHLRRGGAGVPADRDQRARHQQPGGLRLSLRRLRRQQRARPQADGLPGALLRGRRRGAAHPQLHRRQRRRDAPQQRELSAGARSLGDGPLAGRSRTPTTTSTAARHATCARSRSASTPGSRGFRTSTRTSST